MTGNVGVAVTSSRLSVLSSIRNSHNHHFDYSVTIALYQHGPMPLAGRAALVERWIWDVSWAHKLTKQGDLISLHCP